MKSSMSFSKKTLFSHSVSSASISSVFRLMSLCAALQVSVAAYAPVRLMTAPNTPRSTGHAFSFPRRELLQNGLAQFLQFTEPRQIFLEFLVQELRVVRPQLIAQNHVAQFHGMRQHPVFLQFFQRLCRIVVIHGLPQRVAAANRAQLSKTSFYRKEAHKERISQGSTGGKSQAAEARTGMNS